jgi:hypothetical protein
MPGESVIEGEPPREQIPTTAVVAPSRSEWPFALTVAAVFLACVGFSAFQHEMWRDELQAWLIARDSASPLAVLSSSQYEGHPALWFLLLWPVTRITGNPAAMQVLNVAVAGATALLIARFAPAPRWIRAAAALGYFVVYEYGSIARNYALGVLALCAFCAAFPGRRARPVLAGALLAIAADTSLPACVLAIAALLALVVEAIARPPEPPRRLSTAAGLGIAAVGIALSIAQMNPPEDTGFATGWNFVLSGSGIAQVLSTVTKAYLPLAHPGPAFWQSELLAAIPGYAAAAWLVGAALVGLVALALVRRPLALLFYAAATGGLLVFFYVKTLGYLRHHGFLFVALGAALWMARTLPPVALTGVKDRLVRLGERAVALVVPALLVVHVASAAIAVAGESRYVFSGAEGTADLIRAAGLERLPIVADRDIRTVGVVGHLRVPGVLYAAGGRRGSYVVWDTGRFTRYEVWGQAVRVAQQQLSPVVVILDSEAIAQRPPPPELEPFLRPVGCVEGEIVPDESFCVTLVDPFRG